MNTTTLSNAVNQQEQDKFRTISFTALLTGMLQMASVIIKYLIENGKDPVSLIKYIASGVFGKEALGGGMLMIIWGVVFHFMIAFLFTAFLFLVYPVIYRLIKNKYIIAPLYAIFILAIMNFIVIPLSKINTYSFDMTQAAIAAAILLSTVGLPIVLIAHRHFSRCEK